MGRHRLARPYGQNEVLIESWRPPKYHEAYRENVDGNTFDKEVLLFLMGIGNNVSRETLRR